MAGDVKLSNEIKRALEEFIYLQAKNVEIVRIEQSHNIETDRQKVRVELTFER